MKKIKILQNYFPIILVNSKGEQTPTFRFKEGDILIVNEDLARELLKKRVRLSKDNKIERFQLASLIEDLGLHFGYSKHIYIKDGLSKVNL
jgi:hypothetical protein